MKPEDLVVLKYADNTCYTNVVNISDLKDKDFSYDIKKKTWTYKYGNYDDRCPKTYKIGEESRHCSWGCQFGVIGVFDRTDTGQLSFMVSCAKRSTEEPNYSDD